MIQTMRTMRTYLILNTAHTQAVIEPQSPQRSKHTRHPLCSLGHPSLEHSKSPAGDTNPSALASSTISTHIKTALNQGRLCVSYFTVYSISHSGVLDQAQPFRIATQPTTPKRDDNSPLRRQRSCRAYWYQPCRRSAVSRRSSPGSSRRAQASSCKHHAQSKAAEQVQMLAPSYASTPAIGASSQAAGANSDSPDEVPSKSAPATEPPKAVSPIALPPCDAPACRIRSQDHQASYRRAMYRLVQRQAVPSPEPDAPASILKPEPPIPPLDTSVSALASTASSSSGIKDRDPRRVAARFE